MANQSSSIDISSEINAVEKQIFDSMTKLNELRKMSTGTEVSNYNFNTIEGEVTLLELFAGQEKLLVIHNMGQGCRYCTLWADGFNGLLEHLESVLSVVLVSKDAPALQRQFANSRGWRFRLVSHGGANLLD